MNDLKQKTIAKIRKLHQTLSYCLWSDIPAINKEINAHLLALEFIDPDTDAGLDPLTYWLYYDRQNK